MRVSTPTISIITPVFNPGKLFDACLASLEAQTIFDQLEIVLVDDGSTDGSGKRCDDFAAQHGNVRVLHQTNQGQSAARNRAIEAATAAYVLLVDSDDAILPEACEMLLAHAEASGADLIWGDYTFRSLFEGPVAELAARGTCTMSQYMRCALGSSLFMISPCVQLVRRNFLREHGIVFPEGRIFEDQQWLLRLMLHGAMVQRIDYPFYIYNIGDHRSSTTVVTAKRLMDAVDVIYAMIDDIEAADPPQEQREVAETYVANSINILSKTYLCHAPERAQQLVRLRMDARYAYYAAQTQLLPETARTIGPAFVNDPALFEVELARHRKRSAARKSR